MGIRTQVFLLSVYIQCLIIAAKTDDTDALELGNTWSNLPFGDVSLVKLTLVSSYSENWIPHLVVDLEAFLFVLLDSDAVAVLKYFKDIWKNVPSNWVGSDPCGDNWVGIGCNNSRVTGIALSSMGLMGTLPIDITLLSELRTLDLSYNMELTGPLPSSVGNLKNLRNLILVGCGFSGPIPRSIGILRQLVFLSLNSNNFSGQIPSSIGDLSDLYWLDLSDNQLEGPIPVSDGNSSGLDMLVRAGHFHLGNNQLSGTIPDQLFSSNMNLIHVLFNSNNLTGRLPSTLGLVQTLEVLRLDRNHFSGPVPSNLNNLTNINKMFLSNNNLSGPMPDLTGMNHLNYLDMSNNSFDASDVPSWFPTLKSLITLMMERTQIEGQVPSDLFSLSHLETVVLKNNQLNGSLDLGTNYGKQLQFVDLQNNNISFCTEGTGQGSIILILAGNPVCVGTKEAKDYCIVTVPQRSFNYSTPATNCTPVSCSSDRISSPTCRCAYPYIGYLVFRAPSFSNLVFLSYYKMLEVNLTQFFQLHELPVDSISLSNPHKDEFEYLHLTLRVFPSSNDQFNRTGIFTIGFALSNQTYKPPNLFGPYYFIADRYQNFAVEPPGSNNPGSNKSTNTGIIIGAAAGGCALLLLVLLAGAYAYRRKRRAVSENQQNPFTNWNVNKNNGGIPELEGARYFSFQELIKYTNNFSEANGIGTGGDGKVYRGTLPSGQVIAIKRAKQGSMQGAQEFKTEIQLLSRVHHKNVVRLLGFCLEKDEQILIYEYVQNGSLKDSLSGKSGIRLDWITRLKIALGAARGLAYLHELASPPIIHRDVKSTNILLDERLNAKVADFGISKLIADTEKCYVTTQVKGTLGYLDPEYYMSQKLTEKSDVYSFGVMMLELITARGPIEREKHITREMKEAMDKEKDLYNLYEILDPTIGLDTTLAGFEKFVDLAMRCVEEAGPDRPKMNDVVKKIEKILQLAAHESDAETSIAR